ncbi:MAG TPA: AAA family ATPase [Gammaproteobacteria bacterium]
MYLEFFGLREYPFALTPDTGFYYKYISHQEALNVLLVALHSGEGFIKVTGEVGLGKTLLCRKLLGALNTHFVTAYLPNPHLSPGSMRLAIADELGCGVARRATQEELLRNITAKLIEIARDGKRVVICLDEAQAMPDQTLEAVRLLTNLETEKSKLLQVVMFGQPELDERLSEPGKRQLKQRITFSYRLAPMTLAAVAEYLRHRLHVAGYRGPDLFAPRAVRALYHASGGVPRLINILAHKALLAAFGPGHTRITQQHVRLAVLDTEGARRPSIWHPWLYTGLLGIALLAVVLVRTSLQGGWT